MTMEITAEARDVALAADLQYVSIDAPGIKRRRSGGGFTYVDAHGKIVRDEATLQRIRSLVLPPAWENVWISATPKGHVQAVGFDARGRRQYRYHPEWRAARDSNKFQKMIAFAKVLPKIRRRTARALKQPGLPREKVLAAVVQLLEKTLIRVGNEEYAKTNHSYGLTTMRGRHVAVRGGHLHFDFRGKSGVEHEIDIDDPRLARVVKMCHELPGQEVFEYQDETGAVCKVTSNDVNAYLHEIAGNGFTAKDFRTWAGTVLAARALHEMHEAIDPDKPLSATRLKKDVVAAIESVAKRLGNTKAVCRKCYIHPTILETYLDGSFLNVISNQVHAELTHHLHQLRPEEAAVLALLQRRLDDEKPVKGARVHRRARGRGVKRSQMVRRAAR
jgi:DNA topoisomerase-1